ncbi:LLM class flavin-dependent oxidoreductase [Halotalea alkalilenta]|uniref:N5,N10-methylene tetrahydromethanopterin reductase n=1 Tax=Halotalea alkalilenta TaxID=376489 RepID=A0A172YDF0_9GAMM|nr:LLM class flavin-dependent oxidoreductase [Halotalea alkalilenta]ANF57279.1 N5,N10-methylene tetrahydromethanopterin reductase [Halotalea alkalilenta]
MARQLLLNAFHMNCVGHICHGLWRHPRDRSREYLRQDWWNTLAGTLERGLFDGLFLADIVGTYDVYAGNAEAALAGAVQVPVNDPLLLVPGMAQTTRHLGFGVTVNLSYEAPYLLARRFSTLDHLTEGRIGWNVVTGYLDSAARAMGYERQMAHDQRYDRADEYMEIVHRLWEQSWDSDAVRYDRESGIFTDPAKVRPIDYRGRYYRVEGIHLSEPSPQRSPVIFQAGSSPRGARFAAQHAECIFVMGLSKEAVKQTVERITRELAAQGRRREDVRILAGLTVVVGATSREAEEKYAEYCRYASPEGGLTHFASSTGVDFSRFDLDEPITERKSEANQSALAAFTRKHQGEPWTVRRLLEQMKLGNRNGAFVGTPSEVADEMQSWMVEADVDGFNLVHTVVPECFEEFVDLVLPELQSRGIYKTAYAEGTFREKLLSQRRYFRAR